MTSQSIIITLENKGPKFTPVKEVPLNQQETLILQRKLIIVGSNLSQPLKVETCLMDEYVGTECTAKSHQPTNQGDE